MTLAESVYYLCIGIGLGEVLGMLVLTLLIRDARPNDRLLKSLKVKKD